MLVLGKKLKVRVLWSASNKALIMLLSYEIGNGPVMVNCHVNLNDEEVTQVLYEGVNIVDCLELETLNKITEAAQQKFVEDMNEP